MAKSSTDRKHLTIELNPVLELDLVSRPPFRFADLRKKEGIPQFSPVCTGGSPPHASHKVCKVYIGEFASSSVYSKNPTLRSLSIVFESIQRPIMTLQGAKELLSSQPGYSRFFKIKVQKNKNGVELGIGDYWMDGGESHMYLLVMGKNPILISDSNWIDRDSIAIRK